LQLNLFLAVLKSKFAKAKNLLDEKRRARKLLKGDKKKKQKNVLMRVTGWAKGGLELSWCLHNEGDKRL
jgi:hypothetical protein